MSNAVEKRSFKENLKLIIRGYKLLFELSPALILRSGLMKFCNALQPTISVYLSGLVITALSEQKGIKEIILLIAVVVGSNFILSFLIDALKQANLAEEDLLSSKVQMYLGKAGLNFAYEEIEKPETRILRNRIDEAMRARRGGVDMLHRRGASTFENFCKVIISGIMVMPLFFAVNEGAEYADKTVAFFNGPWSAVIILSLIIVLSITAGLQFQNAAKQLFEVWKGWPKDLTKAQYYINEYTGENGAGKDIRLFSQRKLIAGELHRNFDSPKFADDRLKINLKNDSINLLISTSLTGVMYYFIAMRVIGGSFGIGSLVSYTGLILQFITGVSVMIAEGTKAWRNNDYLKDTFEYLDMKNQRESGNLKTEKVKPVFEFRNVSFRYPGTEVYALKDISVKLESPLSYAIVGMNGSGKSTFIKLLCRLYQPVKGEILLNGKNINEYDEESYNKALSVVFQDFNLFSFKLGENVAAKEEYDRDRAQWCLDEVGYSGMTRSDIHGLDTMLYTDFSKDGVEISGGEAQKIAMARALYKDAPVMILDEPTAALDPISEAEIYEKFHDIVEGRLALYISHRLSSCKFCDQILVFDKGELVQEGRHEDLLKETDQKYAELWNAQAKYYQ